MNKKRGIGKKNSQFGTMWICNVEQQINQKIKTKELGKFKIQGFVKGRDLWLKKTQEEKNQRRRVRRHSEAHLLEIDAKKKFIADRIANTDKIHSDLKSFGYLYVMGNYGFGSSSAASQFLKRYCSDFKSQMGKAR